jgi:hypothetical protein
MITVQLCGGLGNQMFQYAAAKALSVHLDDDIALDVALCLKNPDRPFTLKQFPISPDLLKLRWDTIKFLQMSGKTFREHSFEYDRRIWDCKRGTYLQGYFQSEKYFNRIEPLIRKDFTGKFPEPGNGENSVAVHIRRGDYVGNPTYPMLSREYYRKAMDIIESRVDNPVYHTFSDDHRWSTGCSEFEDLMAMSRCKHHIIANSSFSWWGAWLANNPKKIVIAPKTWFTDGRSTKDLIPDEWVRV